MKANTIGARMVTSEPSGSLQKNSVTWLREMLQGLLRRWYIFLGLLLFVMISAYMAYQAVPNSYSAKASMVLMPPQSSVGANGNPYLLLGGMSQALDLLSAKLTAAETQVPIAAANPNISFDILPDRTNSAPVLLATVRGENQTEVMEALDDVQAAIPRTLTALQDSQAVPASSRIGLMALVRDTKPASDTKSKTVSVLFTAGGGAMLAVLLTGLIDGRLLARSSSVSTSTPRRRSRSFRGRRVDSEAAPDSSNRGSSKEVEHDRTTSNSIGQI